MSAVDTLGAELYGSYSDEVASGTPSNIAAPIITGAAAVGQTLGCSTGTWGGAPTAFAYQWQTSADGTTGWADILAGTASTYAIVASDLSQYLRCTVTASNTFGSASAVTAATAQVTQVTGTQGTILFGKQTAGGATDNFLQTATAAQKQWARDHWDRIYAFAGFFDPFVSWSPPAWAYIDAYAIYNPSHPDHAGAPAVDFSQVMKDASGNPLFIPWGNVVSGQLPQYAADFSRTPWRNVIYARAQNYVNTRGYRGVYMDDVNLDWRVSNGTGAFVNPWDFNTNALMQLEDWRRYWAEFMEALRNAIPNAEIVHNPVWYAGSSAHDASNQYQRRELAAADYVAVERGFIDSGITGGTAEWSLDRLLKYMDQVHAVGTKVYVQAYAPNASAPLTAEYNLACYLLINEGGDYVGANYRDQIGTWWPGWDVDLGAALGPRSRTASGTNTGLWTRQFASGAVYVNEPGSPTKIITTTAAFRRVDGTQVPTGTVFSLAAGDGLVLVGTPISGGGGGGIVPGLTVAPAVTGTTVVGSTLTCSTGTWTQSPTSYAYQWQRDARGNGVYSNIGSSISAEVLADLPRGYWKLDEGTGNVADSSGHSHTGTANGSIIYSAAGVLGTAITLNGTNAYISVPDHADFDLGDVLTLEAWVKPGSFPDYMIVIDKGNTAYRLTITPTGRFRLEKPGTGIIASSTVPIPLDAGWHHIVATKNGSTVKLYLDTLDVTGTVTNLTLGDNAIQMGIGAQLDGAPAAKFLNGGLDEVAIYPTELSAARVLAHYQARGTTGGTTNTRVLVDADDGCHLRCRVTALNTAGSSAPATSNAVGLITEPVPVDTVAPVITGTARVGSPLTSSQGTWTNMGGSLSSFTYQWQWSTTSSLYGAGLYGAGPYGGSGTWADLTGATSSLYVPVSGDTGRYLRCVVTATNTGGSTSAPSLAAGPVTGIVIIVPDAAIAAVLEVAWGQNPNAATFTWTNITSAARQLNYSRGRQDVLAVIGAGTGSVLLRDRRSDLDPQNTASPYYPNVVPMVPIQARMLIGGVSYPLFQHMVERWPRTRRETSVYTERGLTTVDAFELFQAAGLAGQDFPTEFAAARINRVLDAIGWPVTRRNISSGQQELPAIVFDETGDAKALPHLQAVVESENGLLFINASGTVIFLGRHVLLKPPYTSAVATFSDDPGPGEFKYTNSVPNYDKDLIVNDWRGQREGGEVQVAEDATSIGRYSRRTRQVSMLSTSDADVLAAMQFRLREFKEPLQRIESITVKPGNSADTWAAILSLELGDRITYVETPPGYAAPLSSDYTVEGITGTLPVGPPVGAEFTLNLWPADVTLWLILNDPARDKFGTGRLAY